MIRYAAIGGGHIGVASSMDGAITRLHTRAERRVLNYDVYRITGEGEVNATEQGFLMHWTPGAERTRVRKVRNGIRCHIEGVDSYGPDTGRGVSGGESGVDQAVPLHGTEEEPDQGDVDEQ